MIKDVEVKAVLRVDHKYTMKELYSYGYNHLKVGQTIYIDGMHNQNDCFRSVLRVCSAGTYPERQVDGFTVLQFENGLQAEFVRNISELTIGII